MLANMNSNDNTLIAQDWQPRLGDSGVVSGLAEIQQAIQIILTTAKGSDPHRPEFGCDIWRYLDQPQNQSTPYLVHATIAALRRWEKRIVLLSVRVQHEVAQVHLELIWQVAGAPPQTTHLQWLR